MRQVVIVGRGGPEKLQLRQGPDPEPKSGEVRIRVTASGINFADILAREGLYPDAPRLPAVVGYEVSGSVDKVGSEVDQDLIGRDVVALTRFGGYSDVVSVPPAQVFEKPAMLSHEQAAATPVAYLTAWQLLVVMGSLKAGEIVLIHNAGGGVGLAAIDIARHVGATIYGTASTGKHAFLLERGLHEAIDYRTRDWEVEVDRLTGGKGVSLIIDPLGGSHWKELPRPAVGRATRHVRDLRRDRVHAAGPARSREGRARHAVVPPGSVDDHEQVGLRGEPRSHVARDRHDGGLGASPARRRRRWMGAPARGQDLSARGRGRGPRVHRRTPECRQGRSHHLTGPSRGGADGAGSGGCHDGPRLSGGRDRRLAHDWVWDDAWPSGPRCGDDRARAHRARRLRRRGQQRRSCAGPSDGQGECAGPGPGGVHGCVGDFCDASKTYVIALDRYGDVLNTSELTVGDVREAGADLAEPREDAYAGAEAAVEAQQNVVDAEQELADARAALEQAQSGSRMLRLSPSPSPSPSSRAVRRWHRRQRSSG